MYSFILITDRPDLKGIETSHQLNPQKSHEITDRPDLKGIETVLLLKLLQILITDRPDLKGIETRNRL